MQLGGWILGAARETWCVYFLPVIPWFRLQIGRGRQYSGEHPGDQYQRSSPPPPPPPTTDRAEMEFVDISLTNDSSLLLHAIHSLLLADFKENYIYTLLWF